MHYLTIIVFLLSIACAQTPPSLEEDKSPVRVTWRVDSLDIPVCKPCDDFSEDFKWKLNKLYGQEISIGDLLDLREGVLYHITMKGDTLKQEKSMISEDILEIYGSDWVDYAYIVERNDSVLILKKSQRITYELGTEPPPNDLIIYLSTVK